ncbi:MAG: hypothetical protein ACXWNX_17695 [Isosphaeraceae bacterium]
MSTITQPITVEQYDRMIEVGIIGEHDQVELIEGRLVPKMGRKRPHIQAGKRSFRAFSRILPPGWHVVKEDPIVASDLSKPEPDLSVVRAMWMITMIATSRRPISRWWSRLLSGA